MAVMLIIYVPLSLMLLYIVLGVTIDLANWLGATIQRRWMARKQRKLSQQDHPLPSEANKADAYEPGKSFRDGDDVTFPKMVWLPKGSFMMGSDIDDVDEAPVHQVNIDYELAVSQYPITVRQWNACVADGGCTCRPDDNGAGKGFHPVTNVSWEDAQQYTQWLSQKTGKRYRLLSESEWEYAARAGTNTRYYHGDEVMGDPAKLHDCAPRKVSSKNPLSPNPWG